MEEESETAERKKALSLANDVELMAKLSALSERIAVRSNDVKNSIIHLGRESKEAAVETQNSLNRFLMLCNIQFVENRVYEEDEEEKKEEDTEKTKTVVMDEASRHARALRLGLAALNEIPEEDIYNSRPLPYIFGTSAYLESDSAGIGDEIQEDKEDVNQEYHIDANTYEQEGQVEEYDDAEPMSSHISYNEEQEEKEPSLFDGDDDLHQGMRQSKAPPPMPSSVPPMPSGDLFGSGGDDYDDLFGAASIIEDRSSTIFGGRSSLLFYDDDENENESEEPTPKQTKQIDDDSGNLFATDDVIQDFNAASAFAGQAPVSERKKRSVPETRVKLPGLFEDDDDTFIPQSTKQKEEDTVIVPESMESHKGLAARGLFDDDDDDDDIDKLLASDSSKLFEAPIFEEDTEKEIQDEEPASTNSGLGDLFSKTSLFDDDEETSTKKTSKKSGVGLFTDDDSDDIFAFPSSRSSASKKNSRDMFSEDKNDLFTSQGDDPIFGDKISGLIFADNENKSSAARKLPGLFASTDSPSLFDERSKDESSVSAANSDMNKNTGDLFANDDDLPTTKNSSQLFADDKPIVLSNSKESKPIQKNKIDKFAGLDIDPTRMLPGARPPPRKSVPEASDEVTDHHALSESNESSIDNSVISSRPIISNKKRRASRKTKFVSQTETPGLEEKLQSTPAIHSVTDLFADNVQDVPASVLSAPVPASSQKKTSGGLFADEHNYQHLCLLRHKRRLVAVSLQMKSLI
uniref:Uncharacterized protein n=1 Tax=Aureoumbra lagunensis TaxID=44058 RepID=A0A6S8B6F1_9STRA